MLDYDPKYDPKKLTNQIIGGPKRWLITNEFSSKAYHEEFFSTHPPPTAGDVKEDEVYW